MGLLGPGFLLADIRQERQSRKGHPAAARITPVGRSSLTLSRELADHGNSIQTTPRADSISEILCSILNAPVFLVECSFERIYYAYQSVA